MVGLGTTAADPPWIWNNSRGFYYINASGPRNATCAGSVALSFYEGSMLLTSMPVGAICQSDYTLEWSFWSVPYFHSFPGDPSGTVNMSGPLGYNQTSPIPYNVAGDPTWSTISAPGTGLSSFPAGGGFTFTHALLTGEQASDSTLSFEGGWFVYELRLDFVTPSTGTIKGGTFVILDGNDFIIPNPDYEPGATPATPVVRFGGILATDVEVISNTQLSCHTPAHGPGSVMVTVEVDGNEADLPNGYFYSGVIRSPILRTMPDLTLGPPLPTTITATAHWEYDPPAGSTIHFTWEAISGPENFESLVTVASTDALYTTIDFANGCPPGQYVFRISGSADEVQGVPPTNDTLIVTIPEPKAPIVGSIKVTV
jgi:hypothetical protein